MKIQENITYGYEGYEPYFEEDDYCIDLSDLDLETPIGDFSAGYVDDLKPVCHWCEVRPADREFENVATGRPIHACDFCSDISLR